MPRDSKTEVISSVCLNPVCKKAVKWGRGRPRLYCGDRCLRDTTAEVRSLMNSLAGIEERLQSATSARSRRDLESYRLAIGWRLQRYLGALATPQGAATTANELVRLHGVP